MLHCSRCYSCELFRSGRRWFDWPMLLLMLQPVRCYQCGHRSYRSIFAPVRSRPHSARTHSHAA